MKPIISVVIPLFNCERYIGLALLSVLNQTFSEIECIVVDDNSSDHSVEVVQKYKDPRLVCIRKDKNNGYPTAMNVGLDYARGEYIARMDADDISAPTRLEKQLAFLENHAEIAFVGTWRYWLGSKKNIYPETKASRAYIHEDWHTVMNGTRRFTDASVLVHHEYVREAGGYRTYQRSGQDVDLWLRILEKHPVAATLPEYLYGRRLLPSAITFSEKTYLNNKIPRLLARERKEKGTDCIMRGEPLNYTFSAKDIEAGKRWRIRMLWNSARNFYKFKEFADAYSFTKAAIRAGGWHPRFARLWGKCMLALLGH